MAKNILNKSSEYEPYFQKLGKSDSNSEKLFSSMKDVYMLALVLGFKHKVKKPLKKHGGEGIKLSIFDEHDKVIMDIIALYENCKDKDLSLLRLDKEDEKYKLIEEYANGGMKIIVDEIYNKGNNLEALKKFAFKYSPVLEDEEDITNILFNNIEYKKLSF